MRRGICTGLGPGADTVINCEVRDCIATAFNVGTADVLQNCRADAKYGEALCLPYPGSMNAQVELEITDSRDGFANQLLAAINGEGHRMVLRTQSDAFVPPKRKSPLKGGKGPTSNSGGLFGNPNDFKG